MSSEASYDRWAVAYQRWWGPVIAPAAVGLLDRLEGLIDPHAAIEIADVGAGTGTLALAALERWPRARAVGVDPSQAMLDLAVQAAARADSLAGRLHVVRGSAERLPLADRAVDAIVSSFAIQLVSSRAAALREMYRVLRPGGLVAVITWQVDDAPFEPDEIVWQALDEAGVTPDPGGDRCPYRSPHSAAAEFRRTGFREVRAAEAWLDHTFTPRSFLDVVEHWSDEEAFSRLPAPRRRRLRERVLRDLERLAPGALRWRRPLVSVTGRRPRESRARH